ncbi:unnamed protein product [Owenia fusiformis]|uniref:C2H2-type domain-containing protein n=1 Tax=Owenia fusiformis TaxID=6347 RepID=A0A8S4NJ25_OWEFU|nr:unnamed protein product [Owenia fusiformis]
MYLSVNLRCPGDNRQQPQQSCQLQSQQQFSSCAYGNGTSLPNLMPSVPDYGGYSCRNSLMTIPSSSVNPLPNSYFGIGQNSNVCNPHPTYDTHAQRQPAPPLPSMNDTFAGLQHSSFQEATVAATATAAAQQHVSSMSAQLLRTAPNYSPSNINNMTNMHHYSLGIDMGFPLPLPDYARLGFPFGKKLFNCPNCRYVTDRKNNLKRHLVTMHQDCDKQLECCGIVFRNKASLRDHVVIFHSNGYTCRYCGRTFCRKALLKRHLTVHSGQKDFNCDKCEYATSHKSNLERHRKVHEREVNDVDIFGKPTDTDQLSPSVLKESPVKSDKSLLFSLHD